MSYVRCACIPILSLFDSSILLFFSLFGVMIDTLCTPYCISILDRAGGKHGVAKIPDCRLRGRIDDFDSVMMQVCRRHINENFSN